MIRRIWSVTRPPDICHFSVIKAPPPPDQTDTFYQQQDTKFRLVASVRCYNVSQTFHPVARCYYRLHWTRHSKHPKPARPSDLRPNTRNTHPRSAIGPTGITGCPPALNPPGHECFPWTETCPGGRDQPASLSLTRTHARARRDENAGMWRLVRFADRTRARGNRGLWEFEFKDNGYF